MPLCPLMVTKNLNNTTAVAGLARYTDMLAPKNKTVAHMNFKCFKTIPFVAFFPTESDF